MANLVTKFPQIDTLNYNRDSQGFSPSSLQTRKLGIVFYRVGFPLPSDAR